MVSTFISLLHTCRKENEMIYATAKEARLAAARSEEEKERKRKEQEDLLQQRAKEREDKDRKEEQAEKERLQAEAAKRSNEIYVNLRTLRIQKEENERKEQEVRYCSFEMLVNRTWDDDKQCIYFQCVDSPNGDSIHCHQKIRLS